MACGTLALQAAPAEPGVELAGSIDGASVSAPQAMTCAGAAGPEAAFYVELDHLAAPLREVTPDFGGGA